MFPQDYLFDEFGNPLDINGNIVDKKYYGAHIPYTRRDK
jgi:hypothetical protein